MTRWLYLMMGIFVITACQPRISVPPASSLTPLSVPTLAPTISNRIQTVVPPEPLPTTTSTCIDTPDTQLIVNEFGRVAAVADQVLNVRSEPGTQSSVLRTLDILEVFRVVDGPNCSDGYVWYQVAVDNLKGWIAEGDASVYYVEPYLPG